MKTKKALKKELSIQEHFSSLNDPRQSHKIAHHLQEIITIVICAVIGGADGWVEVEGFGRAKKSWLKTFLRLPNGIPSHDTFGRVFAMISTEELEKCFLSWTQAIAKQVKGVVAIDGKTLRHSYDTASEKPAIHMVSAWVSEQNLVLGQVKTEEKSNEITAIPQLLNLLELKGCLITIDAMGCQKEIAAKIIEKEADYILALKRNQEGLYEEVYDLFQHAVETDFDGLTWDYHETEDRNHGRHEIRRCWAISDIKTLSRIKEWAHAQTVIMIESVIEVKGMTTQEYRFYISSRECDAEQLARAVRSHWGIENSVHWILDVAFREDDSRIRLGNAAENLSILRRLALNLIKQEKTAKCGVKARRKRAGWDDNYFLKVISG